MTTSPQQHSVDSHSRFLFDTEQDEVPAQEVSTSEDLPEYDDDELPTYQRSSVSHPTAELRFCQAKSRLITIDSLASDQPLSYKIVTKASSKFFSNKPEMSLQLMTDSKETFVAGLAFDNSASIPWSPRAVVTTEEPGNGSKKLSMVARNFADWKIEHDGKQYAWTLQGQPTSLAFVDLSTSLVLARFTYSVYGTTAKDGQEIGDLNIFTLAQSDIGLEAIIGSCTIVIKYWARMGRHHRQGASIMGRYSYGSGITLATLHRHYSETGALPPIDQSNSERRHNSVVRMPLPQLQQDRIERSMSTTF